MVHYIENSIDKIWMIFAIVWLLAAIFSKRAVQRQSYGSRVLQSLLAFCGVVLVFNLFTFVSGGWLAVQIIPHTPAFALTGAFLAVAGLLFCFWARYTLGRNWSSNVTIKQNHELILRGPYAFVRHPIYTGLLAAMLGTAIVYGYTRCFLGVLIIAVAFWLKSQTEEKFMVQQFGEQYADYRQRTRALVPFVL